MQVCWRQFLRGKWRVVRELDDQRNRQSGKAIGRATFSPHEDHASLVCREVLDVSFAGRRWCAYHDSIWTILNANVVRYVANDGFACALERISTSCRLETIYDCICGDDHYRAALEITSETSWRMDWQVNGPRKAYSIRTHYSNRDSTG